MGLISKEVRERMMDLMKNRRKEIRVISTSSSLNMSLEDIDFIKNKLGEYEITFGKNVDNKIPEYLCPSIADRKQDLEDAFDDKNVGYVMIARGGFFTNQLLDRIDYKVIKNNPKPIIGFSDATSLLNAIYAKTGMKTFYGPNFSVLAMRKGNEYTYDYLNKVLNNEKEYYIEQCKSWSSDKWYKNQDDRKFVKNEGIKTIIEGEAQGTIVGGNLNSFLLIQGTKYIPKAENIILFIEDDDWAKEDYFSEFDRRLYSITQQEYFKNVKGIVIGRAQEDACMGLDKWKLVISTNKYLNNIPVVVNADFGHTMPIATFPIGGKCILNAEQDNVLIKIIND